MPDFNRDELNQQNFPNPSHGAQAGRYFEPTAQQRRAEADARNGQKASEYRLPARPRAKASLVERDNDKEFVEFHFNPSSYSVSKEASWNEQRAGKAKPTLEWGGPSLTKVSFDVLFNDLWISDSQGFEKNTEHSLAWLFTHMENRSETARNGVRAKPRAYWMNNRVRGELEPPVLVLFGVSYPFVCRLKSVKFDTQFMISTMQGFNLPPQPTPPQNSSQRERNRFTREMQQFGELVNIKLRASRYRNKIGRAKARIELVEYYEAPQVEKK